MFHLPSLFYYGRSGASALPCAGAAPPQRPPRSTHHAGSSPPLWHADSAPKPTWRLPTEYAIKSPNGGEDEALVITHTVCGLVVTKSSLSIFYKIDSRQAGFFDHSCAPDFAQPSCVSKMRVREHGWREPLRDKSRPRRRGGHCPAYRSFRRFQKKNERKINGTASCVLPVQACAKKKPPAPVALRI